MLRLRSLLLLALLSTLPVAAEPLTLDLDPAATTIQFSFGATFHSVQGSLALKQGTIHFDPQTEEASGKIVMDATSAQTGVERRDEKMHEKILESPRFPEIVFTVERISGEINRQGRSEMELHGQLELHGQRRPVAVPVVATVEGDRVTAEGFLIVSYMEWGMADPSFFLLRVAKEVRVDIKTAGRLQG